MPRFKKRYEDVIRPQLQKEFGYTNPLQAPRIEKVVLNIGAGEAAGDQKKIQSAVNDLTAIAGQKWPRNRNSMSVMRDANALPREISPRSHDVVFCKASVSKMDADRIGATISVKRIDETGRLRDAYKPL